MSRFVMRVDDFLVEECRTTMFDDITLARLMVYAQSIEESKLKRMTRSLKRSGVSDQGKPRFMKRDQGQEEPKSVKVKLEK